MEKLFILTILLISQFSGAVFADECTEGNCVNGQGTYTYTNGSRYVGEFKDGKKHGWGTFIYVDEKTRTGAWFANKYLGTPETAEAYRMKLKADEEQKIERERQQQKYSEQRKIAEEQRKIAEEQRQIEKEREAEELRLAELEKKKSLCRDIGAKDESSDMIYCVTRLMEIEKMDQISEEQRKIAEEQQKLADSNQRKIAEEQQKLADANQEKILNEIAWAEERRRQEEKSRRQSEFLINLGASLGGNRVLVPGKILGSPNMPSPPQGPTGYLKNQMVSGTNRICYYNVLGSTKTLNVSAASTCPISYKF